MAGCQSMPHHVWISQRGGRRASNLSPQRSIPPPPPLSKHASRLAIKLIQRRCKSYTNSSPSASLQSNPSLPPPLSPASVIVPSLWIWPASFPGFYPGPSAAALQGHRKNPHRR